MLEKNTMKKEKKNNIKLKFQNKNNKEYEVNKILDSIVYAKKSVK